MHEHLEPARLASSLFLFYPEEAYEVAIDFLNGALSAQDRDGAVIWTAVLTLLEKMQSDCEFEPPLFHEMRSITVM